MCSTFDALLFVQVKRHVSWWQDYLFGWKSVGWFGESFAAVLTQTFNIYTAPNGYTFKVYSVSQHDKFLPESSIFVSIGGISLENVNIV